ncbi:MAG: hypothetical protein ACJAW1_001706 [Glaciecola sp.]
MIKTDMPMFTVNTIHVMSENKTSASNDDMSLPKASDQNGHSQ